jgi:hypothetical protein
MADMMRALQRLCKWRSFYAGWQLGSRPKGDPESDAVRDAVDARLVMRVELNAMGALLIQKGVFTLEEWHRAVEVEAKAMNRALEERYPGVRATDEGIEITNPEGADTIRRMNFKP